MIDIWAGMLILFAFGLVYEIFVVDRMNRYESPRHPLMAFQVIVGVAVTIGVAWLVDGDCISLLTLFLCLAASGTPMTIGCVFRWWQETTRGDGGEQ